MKHRYFDIAVDPSSLEEDISCVLLELRPEWTKKDLCKDSFTGLLNNMACFYQKWDEDLSDGLVVRVYGSSEVQWSRETEILAMQIAHGVGCFPQLLATFQNGLVYPYTPGRMATFEDLTQPAVIKKLTDLIYRFHHFDIQQMDLFDRQGNRAELSEIGTYLDLNFQVQGTIPDKADDEETDVTFQEVRRELTDEVIKVEQDFLRNFESGFRESMVLCHGDLHPGNILINDDTGEITLLDYEFTSYNFGVYDFGKIWYLRFFFESVGECDEDESEFNDDIKKLYFQDYLEAHCKYMGNDKCQDTDKEIELLDIQARISEIMYSGCYMMSLLALINQGMGEVDLMNVVLLLKEKYFENKGSLPSLRDQYLEKVSAMQAAKG